MNTNIKNKRSILGVNFDQENDSSETKYKKYKKSQEIPARVKKNLGPKLDDQFTKCRLEDGLRYFFNPDIGEWMSEEEFKVLEINQWLKKYQDAAKECKKLRGRPPKNIKQPDDNDNIHILPSNDNNNEKRRKDIIIIDHHDQNENENEDERKHDIIDLTDDIDNISDEVETETEYWVPPEYFQYDEKKQFQNDIAYWKEREKNNNNVHDDILYPDTGLIYVRDQDRDGRDQNIFQVDRIDKARYQKCRRQLHVIPVTSSHSNDKDNNNNDIAPFWTSECDVSDDQIREFDMKYPIGSSDNNPARPSYCGEEVFKQVRPYSNAIKNAINDIIVRATLELPYAPEDQKILVLDASELNTTLRFIKNGIKDIVIPNPYECVKINRYVNEHPETINIISVPNDTLHDYLVKLNQPKMKPIKFTSVWADYAACGGTGSESTGSFPLEDMKILLKKKLLRSPSILAFTTHTTRCGPNAIGKDQIKLFLNSMNENSYGYCFEKLYAGKYHGKGGLPNMGVVILKVNEKNTKNKTDDNGCIPLELSYNEPKIFEKLILPHWPNARK